MKFEDLSEEERNLISPYLPTPAPTGRPRADDRRTINGIRYVLVTSCKWADMPRFYGSSVTAWRRLKNWEERGVWSRIMQQLKNEVYRAVKISIDVISIDSKTVVAKKRGDCVGYDGHKKKKGTKIHAAVSKEGLPLSMAISAGNEHDSRYFTDLADGIKLQRMRGRPKTRPGESTQSRGCMATWRPPLKFLYYSINFIR